MIWSNNIFALIVLSFFMNIGCKEKPTETHEDINSNRRDFSWSVDTLYYTPDSLSSGDTKIYDMSGVNDTTIFAVGQDEWGGRGSLWKFDGTNWRRVKLFAEEGGTFTQALSLSSILVFSERNIYSFGDHYYSNSSPPPNFIHSAMAIHFDGIQWKETTVPRGEIMYNNISYSPNDFYVGGTNGQLFHYSNGIWIVDTISLSQFPQLPLYNINVLSYTLKGIYLNTIQFNPNSGILYYQILLHNKDSTILIDSTNSQSQKWGLNYLWSSPQGTIFSAGNDGIFKFTGKEWIKIFSAEIFSSISGTADNDIFAFGVTGNVYHFDGTDWRIIKSIDLPYPVRGLIAWSDQHNVFISVYHNSKSLIFHGRNKKEK